MQKAKLKNIIFLALAIVAVAALPAFSADLVLSGSSVDVSGPLKMKDSYIEFPDGSRFTSALIPDTSAIWGQISGLIVNQTDLNNALLLKEDKAQKGQINGYAALDSTGHVPSSQLPVFASSHITRFSLTSADFTPVWHFQWSVWTDFTPDIIVTFNKEHAATLLRVFWTDNVGIFDTNWCNIGLFLDDATQPFCRGAWSGSPSTSIFRQEYLDCLLSDLPSGDHIIRARHRSQYCMYGNYAFDDGGLMRSLTVVEGN